MGNQLLKINHKLLMLSSYIFITVVQVTPCRMLIASSITCNNSVSRPSLRSYLWLIS